MASALGLGCVMYDLLVRPSTQERPLRWVMIARTRRPSDRSRGMKLYLEIL